MDNNANLNSRVIGLDVHPDSFTAALLRGQTPAQAMVEKVFNKVPMRELLRWVEKNTAPEDVFLLEASGNSFKVARDLIASGRQAHVLESCQMGKLKEAHANNDKISAIRIGKAWLSATAKTVWIPDLKTQERRDWHHACAKAVKRTTQTRNRLLSYLSDNGVRFTTEQPLAEGPDATEQIRKAHTWSPRQWQVIEGYLMDGRHAEEQRRHWSSLIAQEVVTDPLLLSMVRLCGVRDRVAFSLGAIIGDITRFKSPKKLVSYFGLYPAFDDSGKNNWSGGIGGHGREDIRSLLVQSAQSILRTTIPLAKWGKKLLARKGNLNLVVAAVARKLVVSIWYLMMGKWTTLEEIDLRLNRKVGKIITNIGSDKIKALGKSRKVLRAETIELLKSGRTYVMDPDKAKLKPDASAQPSVLAPKGSPNTAVKPDKIYILKPFKIYNRKTHSPALGDAVPQTP
jgi:transposase